MSKIRTYRSLDRSIQFFGVKGLYTMIAACCGAASLLVAVSVGSATSGIIGLAVFLLLFFISVGLVISLQSSYEERTLLRKLSMFRCSRCLRMSPIEKNYRGKISSNR